MTDYSGVFIDDGLSIEKAKTRYQVRRKTLSETIGHLVLLVGIEKYHWTPSAWAMPQTSIYQDPWVLFYTGLNQCKTACLIDPKNKTETLFIEKKNPKKEFWEGFEFGCGNSESEHLATEITGFQNIRPFSALRETLSKRLQKEPEPLGMLWYESDKPKRRVFKDDLFHQMKSIKASLKRRGFLGDIHNVLPKLWEHRLCLDSVDIKNLREANKQTLQIYDELLKRAPFETETELSGLLNGMVLQKSWIGNSFPPIVAAGKNAAVLHYKKNNAPIPQDSLVLLDYGVKHHSMPADISRTFPISGTPNHLQALLLDIVKETQKTVENVVKEGVTIDELNELCWDTMEQLLKERFTSKGGKMLRPYNRQPHNVGHLLAHMVHDGDPFRDYRTLPLKPGMVITNEPGLYGEFEHMFHGKHYKETIGIRIEDNLLITATGCENLSRQA